MGVNVFPAASSGSSYISQPPVATATALASGVLTSASTTISVTGNGTGATLITSAPAIVTINGVEYATQANTPLQTQGFTGAQTVKIAQPYAIGTWTAITTGLSLTCGGIASNNNNTWVYMIWNGGTTQTTFYYSTDNGSTWSSGTLPSAATFSNNSVIYGGGYFVAIGGNSTTGYYSTNGTSWTSFALPSATGGVNNVLYGNGTFVWSGSGTQTIGYMSTSSMGTVSTSLAPNSGYYRLGTYYNGYFMMYDIVSSNFISSSGTLSSTGWQTTTSITSPGTYSIISSPTAMVGSSSNTTLQINTSYRPYFINGVYNYGIATATTSPIGVDGLAYGGGIWIGGNTAATATYIYSRNESIRTWTSAATPNAYARTAIAYSNGQFIAAGNAQAGIFKMTLSPGTASQPINFGIYNSTTAR